MIVDGIHQNQHCAIDKRVEHRVMISISGGQVQHTQREGRDDDHRVQNRIFDDHLFAVSLVNDRLNGFQ